MGSVKKYMAKPKVSPIQLILLGIFIGWLIISNLSWFEGLTPVYKIALNIGFYMAIMLTAGKLGNIKELVISFMKVIVGDNLSSDQIVIQLQNLLVSICQQLGLYYEDELRKITEDLNKEETREQKIARLTKEIENIK